MIDSEHILVGQLVKIRSDSPNYLRGKSGIITECFIGTCNDVIVVKIFENDQYGGYHFYGHQTDLDLISP